MKAKTKIAALVLVAGLAVSFLSFLALTGNGYPLRDIDGTLHGSLMQAESKQTLLFFLGTYCPISRRYAPEIIDICAEYQSEGTECFLVYPESRLTVETLEQHTQEFGYASPAILDSSHALVGKAGARVTPEAAVFSQTGDLLYRGRIDDWYADLGRPRREARSRDLRDALDAIASGEPVETPWPDAVGCFIEPFRG